MVRIAGSDQIRPIDEGRRYMLSHITMEKRCVSHSDLISASSM